MIHITSKERNPKFILPWDYNAKVAYASVIPNMDKIKELEHKIQLLEQDKTYLLKLIEQYGVSYTRGPYFPAAARQGTLFAWIQVM